MTRILTTLLTENIDNEKFVRLTAPFGFESDVLKKYNLKNKAGKYQMFGPTGMVQDFESVPFVKATNKRGGAAHDIACRIDSDPIVTKAIAAEIYFEIMEYCYAIDTARFAQDAHPYIPARVVVPYVTFRDWLKRWSKWGVVRVWPGYFHKFKLLATCREIAGLEGDPYVTVEKLDALIEKTEQVSADLKDVKVEQKSELIEKTDQVTDGLKEAKVDAEAKAEAGKP